MKIWSSKIGLWEAWPGLPNIISRLPALEKHVSLQENVVGRRQNVQNDSLEGRPFMAKAGNIKTLKA